MIKAEEARKIFNKTIEQELSPLFHEIKSRASHSKFISLPDVLSNASILRDTVWKYQTDRWFDYEKFLTIDLGYHVEYSNSDGETVISWK
jgi:hypothetical protein